MRTTSTGPHLGGDSVIAAPAAAAAIIAPTAAAPTTPRGTPRAGSSATGGPRPASRIPKRKTGQPRAGVVCCMSSTLATMRAPWLKPRRAIQGPVAPRASSAAMAVARAARMQDAALASSVAWAEALLSSSKEEDDDEDEDENEDEEDEEKEKEEEVKKSLSSRCGG